MEDDTLYMPRNEFERRLRVEWGIRAFREYRQQLETDKKEEIIIYPENEFEWKMKEELGFPYFRKYRQQLEEDKEKERKLFEKYKL